MLRRGDLVTVPGNAFDPGETEIFDAVVVSTNAYNGGAGGDVVVLDLLIPIITVVRDTLLTPVGERLPAAEVNARLALVDAALVVQATLGTPTNSVTQRDVREAPIPFAERTASVPHQK